MHYCFSWHTLFSVAFFFSFFLLQSFTVLNMWLLSTSPPPKKRLSLFRNYQLDAVLPCQCFYVSLKENACDRVLSRASKSGRMRSGTRQTLTAGAEAAGPSAGQVPSVVQWHSLFKSTPAAAKCNISPPPSQTARALKSQRRKLDSRISCVTFLYCLCHILPFLRRRDSHAITQVSTF